MRFQFPQPGISDPGIVVTTDPTSEAAERAFIYPVMSHIIIEVPTKLKNLPKKVAVCLSWRNCLLRMCDAECRLLSVSSERCFLCIFNKYSSIVNNKPNDLRVINPSVKHHTYQMSSWNHVSDKKGCSFYIKLSCQL